MRRSDEENPYRTQNQPDLVPVRRSLYDPPAPSPSPSSADPDPYPDVTGLALDGSDFDPDAAPRPTYEEMYAPPPPPPARRPRGRPKKTTAPTAAAEMRRRRLSDQIDHANPVLLYCTPTYRKAFETLRDQWKDAERVSAGLPPSARFKPGTADSIRFMRTHGPTHLLRAALAYFVANHLAPLRASLGLGETVTLPDEPPPPEPPAWLSAKFPPDE